MTKLTDTRTVIQDFWYTDDQIESLGRYWQSKSPRRLFVSASAVHNQEYLDAINCNVTGVVPQSAHNCTGLRQRHVDQIVSFPFYIMLPMNLNGYHWTSIAISISKPNANNQYEIKMVFSDSNGCSSLKPVVNQEMDRIEKFFKVKFTEQNSVISREVYKHTWQQSDGCSCGPYSIINAQRCLAGIGHQKNPGQKAIRKFQLNRMDNAEAIRECSTNNEIDQILSHWIIERFSQEESFEFDSSSLWFAKMTAYYASAKQVTPEVVTKIILNEYISEQRAHKFLMKRMRELLGHDEHIREVVDPRQLQKQLKLFHSENVMVKMENIRKKIESSTGGNELVSYQLAADIIEHLSKMNLTEAVEILTGIIKNPEELNVCLLDICNASGSRRLEKDYLNKLKQLAKSYRKIHHAGAEILKAAQSIDPDRVHNIEIAKLLLEEQIKLLNKAIVRNDASLVGHVAYLISDFCSSIVQVLTLGWWEPDYRRIEAINKRLSPDDPKQVNSSLYQKECQIYRELLIQMEEVTIPGRVPI